MWLFSAAASLFVAAPVALAATWQVPRGTKTSRNISLKSIFRLFREIYSSERKIVTLASCSVCTHSRGASTILVLGLFWDPHQEKLAGEQASYPWLEA